MKRSRLSIVRVYACLVLGTLAAATGSSCPVGGNGDSGIGNSPTPTPPEGNRPPRIFITSVSPTVALQGSPVGISITGDDAEDAAVARVFASTSDNPTSSEELPIASGIAIGPGQASSNITWDTSAVNAGAYNIFAEIDDRTYNPADGTGNLPVRVIGASKVTITPPGTQDENTPPTLSVQLPSIDIGLSNNDQLTIGYQIGDAESDKDALTIVYLFDKDRDSSNDSAQPPIVVGTESITAGTIPAGTQLARQANINIDLSVLPFRSETDELGRPLPYFVRVQVSDGKGGIVNAYAGGAVQLLASASGVVDLLSVGGRTAGATFQGFGGVPNTPLQGDRAGSAFAPLGDVDGDGIDDFAIVSETASPFGLQGVGEVYAIYGRKRRIDSAVADAAYTQGRLSGVLSLNTVGSWVDFPPSDPRFRKYFKIRGNAMPHTHDSNAENNTLGITSVVAMPDVTNDLVTTPSGLQIGRPEMFAGTPYAQNIADVEDLDPCDACSFPTNEVAPITLLTNVRGTPIGTPLTGQVANVNVTTGLDTWVPFNPPSNSTFTNVTINGLTQDQLLDITSFVVIMSGRIQGLNQGQSASVTIKIQFEDNQGYLFTSDPIMTETGGTFTDARMNVVGGLAGPLDPYPMRYDGKLPPSVYDGVFAMYIEVSASLGNGVQINSANVEIQGVLASTVDRPVSFVYRDGLPLPISGNEGCAAITPQPVNPFALSFLASELGDQRWHGVVPPPVNLSNTPLALRTIAEPVYDQTLRGHRDTDVFLFSPISGDRTNDDTFGPYESGLVYMMSSNQLILGQDAQGRWDGSGCPVQPLGQFGQKYGPCLSKAIKGARFRGAWYSPEGVGDGVGVTGGGPTSPYEPTSLFGYTVDVMPDLDGIFSPTSELLISAPNASTNSPLSVDLSGSLSGTYDESTPSRTATFNFNQEFSRVTSAFLTITGTAENLARVRMTLLDANDQAIFGGDTMVQLWNGTDINQDTFYRDYFGDSSQGTFPKALFNINGIALRFPGLGQSEFGATIVGVDLSPILASGTGKLRLEILPAKVGGCCIPAGGGACDCQDNWSEERCYNAGGTFHLNAPCIGLCGPGSCPALTGPPPLPPEYNGYPVVGPKATITTAIFTMRGTASGRGNIWIIEGQDYSTDGAISALCNASMISTGGDPESGDGRPMSWPETGCDTDPNPNIREYCYPQNLAYMTGEGSKDALGWAHPAGDPNIDAVPDIICGAPLASSVAFGTTNGSTTPAPPNTIDLYNCPPQESGANLRTKNGKVYLIYGTPTLQNGAPCVYERFEIRGSHDNDQFGRVQGAAGDMNGDGLDDIFFAAEGYDAIDNLSDGVTIQNRGADAGFVGVMFGRATGLTGEIAVNCERIGTASYPGVKFIGGSAGARLGGSTPSRSNLNFYPAANGTPAIRYKPMLPIIERGQTGAASAGDFNQDGVADLLMTAPGQSWPSASVAFNGPVSDGSTITIVGPSATRVFEFDADGLVGATNIPVRPASLSAADAQAAFFDTLVRLDDEGLNAAGITSRTNFPDPLPDIPTVTFVAKAATGLGVTTTSPSVGIKLTTRQGVAYLVFGSTSLLNNKTFYLPEDINRRVSGARVLKGMIFVSPYEKNTLAENDGVFDPLETPDEAPIEAVARIGDIDADGFPDIILGAPQADLINIAAPEQRRQSAGEAYVIYGNQVGLNAASAP